MSLTLLVQFCSILDEYDNKTTDLIEEIVLGPKWQEPFWQSMLISFENAGYNAEVRSITCFPFVHRSKLQDTDKNCRFEILPISITLIFRGICFLIVLH